MTPKIKNHIFSIICLALAFYDGLPQGGAEIIPPKYKAWIEGVVATLMYIKGHYNLYVDPSDVNKAKKDT